MRAMRRLSTLRAGRLNRCDFGCRLLSGATGPSVVRIRIEGQRAEGLATLLLNVLKVCKDNLIQGAMIWSDRERSQD